MTAESSFRGFPDTIAGKQDAYQRYLSSLNLNELVNEYRMFNRIFASVGIPSALNIIVLTAQNFLHLNDEPFSPFPSYQRYIYAVESLSSHVATMKGDKKERINKVIGRFALAANELLQKNKGELPVKDENGTYFADCLFPPSPKLNSEDRKDETSYCIHLKEYHVNRK